MQKKRYNKQVESLTEMMLTVRTVPQAHITEAQAAALSKAILADDALVPRELIVGIYQTYNKLLKEGKIKKDASFDAIIKYAKN
jgi:hypothetical protein